MDLTDVQAALRSFGLEVDTVRLGPPMAGKFHRVRHKDDPRGKKSGWYVVREFSTKNRKSFYFGSYGRWQGAEHHPQKLEPDTTGKDWQNEDHQRLRDEWAKADADAAQAVAREQANVAAKCADEWAGLSPDGSSDYLDRKRVKAYGLRFAKGTAVVPLVDAAGKLHSLQWLYPDGEKKLATGGRVTGCFAWVGIAPSRDYSGPLFLGEGYTTVAAVHEAMSWTCIAAINCNNLMPVAQALKLVYPRARWVVLADDDAETATRPHMHGKNPGLYKANTVAGLLGAKVARPHLPSSQLRNVDWNDVWVEAGKDAVVQQLEAAMQQEAVESTEPPNFEAVPLEVLAADPEAQHANKDGRQRKTLSDVDEVAERFSLIFGTETAFDHLTKRDITLGALRAYVGTSAVNAWKEHPDRRVYMPEEVVFDPRRDPNDRSVCNRYKGWPTPPSVGTDEDLRLLDKWLKVAEWVFGGKDGPDEALGLKPFDWFMNWLAYQVQNPGAKMKTCLVVRGSHGTGKNTVFDPIVRLFGDYGTAVGPQEIEDKYTAWASRKMFVLCDEAVSPEEQSKQKGRMKSLITGHYLLIERKFFDRHMEQNRLNFVFLSNELKAVKLEHGDRRYMVVQTPNRHPDPRFYKGLGVGQLQQGFFGELMTLLLNWQIPPDFDEYTHPIWTEAKGIMLEAGLSGHELFYYLWSEGRLDMPFMSCTARQLFRVYELWSQRTRQSFIKPPDKFWTFLKGRSETRWASAFLTTNDGAGMPVRKQVSCFRPDLGQKPEEQSTESWLTARCKLFADHLKRYEADEHAC